MCLTDRNNAVRVAALEVLLELLARPEGTAPFDPMVSYQRLVCKSFVNACDVSFCMFGSELHTACRIEHQDHGGLVEIRFRTLGRSHCRTSQCCLEALGLKRFERIAES